MKKFKIVSLIVIVIGFVCLYAGQTIDELVTQQDPIVESVPSHNIENKIQLFMYDGCSYCVKVVDFLKQHNLMDKVEFIDAGIAANRELLRSTSGRTQAPYLVDRDAGIKMPESLDIIAYLMKKFDRVMPLEEVMPAVRLGDFKGLKKYDISTFLSYVQTARKPVVILVSTTWCPPCKVFKPIFLQLAEKFTDSCEFICLDGDENRDIVNQLGVQCYPSIVCYKNGLQINPENYRSQEGLTRLINQLLLH